MKEFRRAITLTIALNMVVWAQDSTTAPTGNAPQEQPGNAGQTAKPAEPAGHTTLIGCLSGPGASGKYTLRSMEHRTGVEVFGSDDLKKGSGEKVKLTGSWNPGDSPAVKGKESRKFQASEVEVMSEKCEAPSEKTPVSKQKQEKQQQKQKAATQSGGDGRNPK